MSIEQGKKDINKENDEQLENNIEEQDAVTDEGAASNLVELQPETVEDINGQKEDIEQTGEAGEEVSEMEEDEAAGPADGPEVAGSETDGEENLTDTEDVQQEDKPKPRTKKKKKKEPAGASEPQKPARVIHMVFDQPGGQQIKQSFELEPEMTGEVVYIEDNYSLGPIADLQQAEGWQARKQWWQSVLGLPEEEQPAVMSSDKMKLHQLLQELEQDEDTVLWIWMGQNERDVAGYFHVISQVMQFQGRIQVLYLNNLPFIDEKGHIFYPRQLAEILPKEFVKASRLARVVTLSEFELDPEEWDKLSKQPGSVRLLEGGKKLSVMEDDYYDKIILDQLGSATMKFSRLQTLLTTKAKLGLPEYYIVWRIKSLVESGQILMQGDFDKGAKNVSLKATQGQMFVELNPDDAGEEAEDAPNK